MRAAGVTPSFFRLVTPRPIRGRTLTDEDLGPASEYSILDHGNTVFVSERLWREAFGARENLIGGSIHLDGRRVTVVGIAPEGFDFPLRTDLWLPLLFGEQASVDWGSFRLGVVGRVQPGRSLADVQVDANGVAELYRNAVPRITEGMTFPLTTVKERLVQDLRPNLVLPFVLAGLVLLVICTNLASLFLITGVVREREFAIRVANGASPGDLLAQLTGEMAVILALASVLALAAGAFGLSVLNSIVPDRVSFLWSFRLDLWSLGFCLLVATGAGALTGLWPVRRATRLVLTARLIGLGATKVSGTQGKAHAVFVAAQVALAIVIGTSGFVVAQASEAGVRSALGAGPLSLIWFLSRRGAICLVAGLPFGLVGGMAAVRVAQTALPGAEGPGMEAAVVVCGTVFLTAGIAIIRPVLSTVRRDAMGLIQHGLWGRSA